MNRESSTEHYELSAGGEAGGGSFRTYYWIG
ncbi:hypothetical protein 8G_00073 [Ralstonia phage Hyacinthe]|uniref:Uncharacterized protein n=3 Tax=Rahariannevirus raharianne TaxID=2846050 RepID=A0A7G5BBB2_9CAUD|nr:hypothetical protein KMC43_gp16 [Ralstonia phage Raharianne]QMV32391.1 hypothetical protein U2_00016 [Ralstonia phage Albius]QMV33505.1 hypothetical protein 8G_00073 [Ralstonia phage Hyacinthe]QMV33585.1 hypothetical protein Y2_00016 [Ralstonia phage Raharianne]